MTNLTKLLQAKKAESNLSLEAIAKAIGVSTVSVRGVLSGKSKPNAQTAAKYAAYLGVDIAPSASAPGAKKAKAGKKANAGKKTTADKATTTAGPDKKPAAGTKGGKAAKAKAQPAKAASKRTGLGSELVAAISGIAGVLDDELAMAVFKATAEKRLIISSILGL